MYVRRWPGVPDGGSAVGSGSCGVASWLGCRGCKGRGCGKSARTRRASDCKRTLRVAQPARGGVGGVRDGEETRGGSGAHCYEVRAGGAVRSPCGARAAGRRRMTILHAKQTCKEQKELNREKRRRERREKREKREEKKRNRLGKKRRRKEEEKKRRREGEKKRRREEEKKRKREKVKKRVRACLNSEKEREGEGEGESSEQPEVRAPAVSTNGRALAPASSSPSSSSSSTTSSVPSRP